MFRKMYWKHILVGDFVHISNEQDIPADVLFLSRTNGATRISGYNVLELTPQTKLASSDLPTRMAAALWKPATWMVRHGDFVEAANGASSLLAFFPGDYRSLHQDCNFIPPHFTGTVFCEPPDPAIYTIRAKIERAPGSFELITKDNMLLRGSRLRNTTFIEGIVLYAGHDTKVMMNNGRAPHKISFSSSSSILTFRFILLCMVILTLMVIGSALMSGVWLGQHPSSRNASSVTADPYVAWNSPKPAIDGVYNIGAFLICYQVIVPISLYITVEIIKLAQIFFLSQDIELYAPDVDRAIDCRSLNIPEELGQVSHVLSDKTGTLTENVMIFRKCAFDCIDYGPDKQLRDCDQSEPTVSLALRDRVKSDWQTNTHMKHFFLNMVLNNSVVVNTVPHHDALEVGFFEGGVYNIGNSSFYDITAEQFKEMVDQVKSHTAPPSR
ncbi:hypothetical protein OSTOST_18003 [Ostertagia ostertagi]